MVKNDIDVHTMSRRSGHTRTSILLDIYVHAIPGSQEKAAAVMDEITTPVALPAEFTAQELPTSTRISVVSAEDPS
jgi:hypothetical protein